MSAAWDAHRSWAVGAGNKTGASQNLCFRSSSALANSGRDSQAMKELRSVPLLGLDLGLGAIGSTGGCLWEVGV